MSTVQLIIRKIDSMQMAIECLEVLILEFDDEHLKPTSTYLREQKQKSANELANVHKNLEVQYEEISRLSHFNH